MSASRAPQKSGSVSLDDLRARLRGPRDFFDTVVRPAIKTLDELERQVTTAMQAVATAQEVEQLATRAEQRLVETQTQITQRERDLAGLDQAIGMARKTLAEAERAATDAVAEATARREAELTQIRVSLEGERRAADKDRARLSEEIAVLRATRDAARAELGKALKELPADG